MERDCLRAVYPASRSGDYVRVWIEQSDGDRPRPIRAAEIVVPRDDGTIARNAGIAGDVISLLVGELSVDPIDPDTPVSGE